jgi:hypothetical protein
MQRRAAETGVDRMTLDDAGNGDLWMGAGSRHMIDLRAPWRSPDWGLLAQLEQFLT